MKVLCIVVLLASVYFVCSVGVKDYVWGDIDATDYLLKKETVTKTFFLGRSVSKKYIFKQKDEMNAMTITGIRVSDNKKNGATAELLSGGPGSKGATIKFKSQKSKGIDSLVEIYTR